MLTLSGKVAIVAGAGGAGSGRTVARRFAAEGANVVVSDLETNGAAETVALIKAHGGQAVVNVCDVRDEPK